MEGIVLGLGLPIRQAKEDQEGEINEIRVKHRPGR